MVVNQILLYCSLLRDRKLRGRWMAAAWCGAMMMRWRLLGFLWLRKSVNLSHKRHHLRFCASSLPVEAF
jgi:hypothetical protein